MKSAASPQSVDRVPCHDDQTITELARVKAHGDHVFVVARLDRTNGRSIIRVAKWLPAHSRWVFLDEFGIVWMQAIDALRDEAHRQREEQRT